MIEELQRLGLSYYESKALAVLLKKTLTAKELSDEADIPAGKTYSVIISLQKKNLVQATTTRPKKFFVQQASSVLQELISKKQEEVQNLLTLVRTTATEIDKSKLQPTPFFDIGTTVEDNKRIQLRTFTEAQNEVSQIINVHHKPQSNRKSKTVWEKEIVSAVKRGVVFRAIYPANTVLPPILAQLHKKHPQKFQVKRLNTVYTRCDIIDDKKVLLKLVSPDPLNFGGVLFIENEKFAANLKKVFEQLWEEAD
ncbi:MAG: hypothetical protein HY363_05860 [Candidatus Aenigmarchaeota archaeon]|nr:hypothetical protein [Candidatus Aenigmarchaeota archaeon]